MQKALYIVLFLSVAMCLAACGSGAAPEANSNANKAPERVCEPISDTPTEAYKRLYAAVKGQNVEGIKAEMSKKSQEFAEMLAARQNNPIEKVYSNGFTATTFAPTLPEIRDERISGCYGGIEVRNNKEQRWEDLPFVIEDGKWKFASGELFAGTFKSPGKSRNTVENEAANTASGGIPVQKFPTENVNTANTNAQAPKYDGPQVEPMPKKK